LLHAVGPVAEVLAGDRAARLGVAAKEVFEIIEAVEPARPAPAAVRAIVVAPFGSAVGAATLTAVLVRRRVALALASRARAALRLILARALSLAASPLSVALPIAGLVLPIAFLLVALTLRWLTVAPRALRLRLLAALALSPL
jgi:hypothetical protein